MTQSLFKPKEKVEEESQSKTHQMLLLLLFAKKRNKKKKIENESVFERFQIVRSYDFPFKK